MNIALLGDIHANLPALEAVLAHASEQHISGIWNIGDIVGYGAHPNQVIELLREVGAISIAGNYDLKVLRFPKRKSKWKAAKLREKYVAFRWAHDELSRKNRRYIEKLPGEIRMQLSGKRILLTHGSPASNEEHLTPSTPDERLRELAAIADSDVIICGHSHQPFVRRVDEACFINTGSVGRPDDGDPRACYALLTIEESGFQVVHHRVSYDVERAVAALRKRDLPEAFAQMLLMGHDLDTVLAIMQGERKGEVKEAG